ncbi:MAG: D-alanyl-D-alanine carboxypeptidase DacB precursor [Parcubacteria group bacterium ADurb.Bin247]|nr:MAG: D-alanyl-D-alanine carboxypeptidase DacB precursor [Parcubacteria group bacterium ADurb.Bin247]
MMNFKNKKIIITGFVVLVSFSIFGLKSGEFNIIAEDNSEEVVITIPPVYENEIPLVEDTLDSLINNKSTFIYINLENMKADLYKDGNLDQEIPILARGNDLEWSGSPAGIHEVLASYVTAYSVSSYVYMPYAIQYYGKYFTHGVPYYPGGKKLVSRYSGGCLRFSNENAKKIFDFSKKGMPVIVIDKNRDDFSGFENPTPFPESTSESYLIADLKSGHIFAQKNINQKMPIASITKLMTALVAVENIDLKKNITITKEDLEYYGDNLGIEIGDKHQLIQLLYPTLTRSANHTAEAIRRSLGSDSLEMMNKKAKTLMMNNTFFADGSGLDKNNVSTAQDLFYLGRYIYYNRYPLLEITKGKTVPLARTMDFDLEEIGNLNIFINDPTFIGGKTGYTKEAGQTALFLFKLNYNDSERIIAMIFLNAKNSKWETQKAYRWLLNNGFEM